MYHGTKQRQSQAAWENAHRARKNKRRPITMHHDGKQRASLPAWDNAHTPYAQLASTRLSCHGSSHIDEQQKKALSESEDHPLQGCTPRSRSGFWFAVAYLVGTPRAAFAVPLAEAAALVLLTSAGNV